MFVTVVCSLLTSREEALKYFRIILGPGLDFKCHLALDFRSHIHSQPSELIRSLEFKEVVF